MEICTNIFGLFGCVVFCVRYYVGVGFERKEKFMLIVITIYAVIVTVLLIISLNA